MSKYSSYSVGYAGDYASVTLGLVKPIISESSMPKDKYNRASFQVITTSETFRQATLSDAVEKALHQKDYSTYVTLLNAQSSLNHFISENGSINPNEAADWETVQVPELKMA